MSDWRRDLAHDIRALLGPSGAGAVHLTLPADQADQLARGLDLWANVTEHRPGEKVHVVGSRGEG